MNDWLIMLGVALLSFVAEYMDATIGMGYGTSLTPLLLLMGYDPMQVVPVLLFSQLICGWLGGLAHHSVGNVHFRPKTLNPFRMVKGVYELGIRESFHRGFPLHLKVALLLGACSLFGVLGAIFVAMSVPKIILKAAIGVIIILIGFVIILTINKTYKFSWRRLTLLGFIASFNKGVSGGGYGPLVTGGQILAGISSKNAIGITTLAEGITSTVGFVGYLAIGTAIDYHLALPVFFGALLAVPLSAHTVRRMQIDKLKYAIGVVVILLGTLTLYQALH